LRANLTLATDAPTMVAISESEGFLPAPHRIARRASFTLRMMLSILAYQSIESSSSIDQQINGLIPLFYFIHSQRNLISISANGGGYIQAAGSLLSSQPGELASLSGSST
jgi:hypothetical protein